MLELQLVRKGGRQRGAGGAGGRADRRACSGTNLMPPSPSYGPVWSRRPVSISTGIPRGNATQTSFPAILKMQRAH